MAPRFRRPRRPLSPDQVADLVRMRDVERATWKDIGRACGKQEGDCRAIYERAKTEPRLAAPRLPSSPP